MLSNAEQMITNGSPIIYHFGTVYHQQITSIFSGFYGTDERLFICVK